MIPEGSLPEKAAENASLKKSSAEIEERIKELLRLLEETRRISPKNLAAQIQKMGFRCLRCGDCCTGYENSVVVFPFEIRRMLCITGADWQDVAEPPAFGEWDKVGDFHTLEWRLKKESGSCKFYSSEGCRIYAARPLLCSTYPFYLDAGVLCRSECRGLGEEIDSIEAEEIAEKLIERSITEISEAISLLKRYRDFERGQPKKGGSCIVHDSEGEHRISSDSAES
ncbi:MAG TPA: YkgJ family cysteine cluster protein [Methanothrix sp.]|nr:YkgJ family cysteine cluster protein [Methanothrix sp.]